MSLLVRRFFPHVLVVLAALAFIYATRLGTLPPADLSFHNGTELKTVDPAKATGVPEGRVLEGLFEGLMRAIPREDASPPGNRENTPVASQPGAADRFTLSDDGTLYTFHIRETARWSNGDRLTAHDFAWSWQRMLHPETASEYAYQLWYIAGARAYTEAKVNEGDAVEIELTDRPRRSQNFPRGTLVRGTLQKIIVPSGTADAKEIAAATIYEVQVGDQLRRFASDPEQVRKRSSSSQSSSAPPIEPMILILPDFEKTVGVKVPGEDTLEIRLSSRTPYFIDLLAFYPLYPVHRPSVEKYGSPFFTQPDNLVTNGAYRLAFRRIRDRIRLEKNPHYWNADNVPLQSIDVYAISSDIAALNMYLTGKLDWITNVPATIIPDLRHRDDFHSAPQLGTYFYRVNCTRKPLDDKRVRRALALTIEKEKICEKITRGGEVPGSSLVPLGMSGYTSPAGAGFDVEQARRLLAEAGYPNGQGIPKIEIIFNTHETHQDIAEVLQEDWKKHLGIEIELRALEWGTYLDHQQKLQYDVARAAWTADYPDPNTFVDMFVTGGANNQTGWGNPQYDELVQQAAAEASPARRLELLAQAEAILLDELPILPIYYYVSKSMVKPHVTGYYLNARDLHPLHLLGVRKPSTAAAAKGATP